MPIYSCSSPSQIGLVSPCLTIPPARFTIAATEFDLLSVKPLQPAPAPSDKFHWKPALGQSFGFLVVGHGFRLANDGGARYLLFHKPFWHDYWASADNFHMSHWGDGDSFIVNYIGHPMEGAVAGYIFLNNDPKGGSARFGKSSTYWYSRLKAMAWAAAFEAYFEIGPVLSEAAIGNEGGCTYVSGCGLYPCDKYPGKHFKPPTNNTGWVDFVITPTVGMGWIVLEDAIERELVDRLADGSPALKYKILRGSLAPSHTFANMFAGKKPWFRYPAEGSFTQTFGGSLHPAERPLWKDRPRHSFGVQLTPGQALEGNSSTVSVSRSPETGISDGKKQCCATYEAVAREAGNPLPQTDGAACVPPRPGNRTVAGPHTVSRFAETDAACRCEYDDPVIRTRHP